MKNPFYHLRKAGDMFAEVDELSTRQIPIFTDSKESVYVLTAKCGDDYVVGYGIIYADGSHIRVPPSPMYGAFATEDDARKFCVAAIAERSRVTDDTRRALEHMVIASLQTSLF